MTVKKSIIFMENIHGNLANEIKGLDREEKWSDLWYIFKPKGFEKTLAEMDAKEREERRKIEIHRPDYGRDKSSIKKAKNRS